MKPISTIVVPVDFLDYTDRLVDFAVHMAKKLDAGLRFLHVVEEVHIYGDYVGPTIEDFTVKMGDLAEEKMKNLVEANRNTCSGCEGKVARGANVADTIIAYAKEVDGDMIIVGTHGRKGLERVWLGSVAERVVKGAPCPTLTYNPYK
ncbi:universal stress protein [Desulfogranum mediterraneum]|uniref:universal stress protein n=1 Tax=Desulfogranum mediterraneum TaxID=160661 RepID=UPI00041C9C15|nr:universal stress protein [Desulfogranum mediterraneum]